MAGALRALGGAFKAGLSPAVGVSLSTDGVTLARFEKKKKSVELSNLVHWELPLPEEISRKEIRRLAKQLMCGCCRGAVKSAGYFLGIAYSISAARHHCR